jgi:hypothetical protein
MAKRAGRLAASLAVLAGVLFDTAPAHLNAAGDPLDTPTTMVRFYFHALGSGQCALASKFAGQSGESLSAFLRSCRAIRRIVIDQLTDPGYRLRPQNAMYTCLGLRYTLYRHSGAATFGGWYLLERTLGPTWQILFSLSHITNGGSAVYLTKAQCASHLPSYVHPSSGTLISGSGFLSASASWIALSTSGSYLPSGSCSHGIGSNCETAPTSVYRTDDAGSHWIPVLHFTAAVGPPVWIRLFSRQVGMVAATVGPLKATPNYHFTAALFSTYDGGHHWRRSALPVNYVTETGSISFPDPQHGWLWYGGGAGGSMAVDVYRTTDAGRHWNRVACTSFSSSTPGYCTHQSGIGLSGDKTYLTFKDAHEGWLEVQENSGVPDIYHTADGGTSWFRQPVGLPPGVFPLETGKSTVFPSGTLLQPSFLGRLSLLPEEVGFYRPKPRASWNRLYLFRSQDGGRTWRSAVRTPLTGPVALWQAVDSRRWLFAAAQATSKEALWGTDNGGISWTKRPLHVPAGLALLRLYMTDRAHGWATAQTHADSQVSASGTVLLHTMDGGVHWSEKKLP